MPEILCYCGAYMRDPNKVEYVRDGKPLCNYATCSKVRHHKQLGYQLVPLASFEDQLNAAG